MGCGSSHTASALPFKPKSDQRCGPSQSHVLLKKDKNNNTITAEGAVINSTADVSSTEISFEKVALLCLDTPTQIWDAVRQTCYPHKSWTIEKKSRRGWKTIRLFVSSTFRDFHAEREVLVKEVFPDLRLWCEQRKLHLVECDLRWGVPKDSTSEETIRICLEVLDRCHEENVLPYFLNLTCERVGMIPKFGDLTYNLAAQYGWVYGLSITEMEIVHGAFRKCNPNALFLIRNGEFTSRLPEDLKSAFVQSDSGSQGKLQMLKQVIQEEFPKTNIGHYSVECASDDLNGKTERDVRLEGLSGQDSLFYRTVFNFFKTRIEEQYPLDVTPGDPLEAQRISQESFLDIRSQSVLGRDNVLMLIEDYIRDNPKRAPLLIVGNAGSGKSAIMAKSAHDTLEKSRNSTEINFPGQMLKWKVFFHFVGATPGSTDLAFFLQRLTKELNPDKTDVFSDFTDFDTLIQMANSLLSNHNSAPIIVFVDAINQMDEDKLQYLTRWLPDIISPNVRIVLSMIDETECHRILRSYKTNPTELFVGELDFESRKAIAVNTLSHYNKSLDSNQMDLLLGKKGSANPLWLCLACEELRVYGVFETVNEKIESLSDELISLEEQVLTRFEEENGGQLVVATVCLLETSRHGLLESELLELLADENNLTPPIYIPRDDEIRSTETKVLEDKPQEQVNVTSVQKDGENDHKDKDGEKKVDKGEDDEEKDKFKGVAKENEENMESSSCIKKDTKQERREDEEKDENEIQVEEEEKKENGVVKEDIEQEREKGIDQKKKKDILQEKEKDIIVQEERDIVQEKEKGIGQQKERDIVKEKEKDIVQENEKDIVQEKKKDIEQKKEKNIEQDKKSDKEEKKKDKENGVLGAKEPDRNSGSIKKNIKQEERKDAEKGEENSVQEEEERQEREGSGQGQFHMRERSHLPAMKWASVYRALKPFLRPCGDSGEGRLDFYHRSISKAVRRKYFGDDEKHKKHMYTFWHGRLAEFFEHCEDLDRKSEELPYHLEQLLDNNRLTRCLLEWPVFVRLYSEDFSIELLRFWQKAGGYAAASNLYREFLNTLESSGASPAEVGDRKLKVITFLIQAGQYKVSLQLLQELLVVEEEQMGARTEMMADIYQLIATTKSEICERHLCYGKSHLSEYWEIVECCRKCIEFREKLSGDKNELKLGILFIIMAIHLGNIRDSKKEHSLEEQMFSAIDKAIAIFKTQNDMGHLAEALTTKSYMYPRTKKYFDERIRLLTEARDMCAKIYGEKHKLMVELHRVFALTYHDNKDYETGYNYRIKFYNASLEVLGPSHPRTKKAASCLKKKPYAQIGRRREQAAQTMAETTS